MNQPAAAQPPPLLTMRGVQKRFGATYALRGVDLSVEPGSVHALIGENGAGKSTLMKTLSGAYTADAGEMTLDGQPYTPSGPLHARALGVCMIYQELALAPHLSVTENILLGIEPATGGVFLHLNEMRATARRALDEVGLEDVDPNAIVGQLSIAEQQLVEIARAVAVGCRLLVLDEPTSSLTQKDVRKLFALVRRLQARQVAVVYISHALEEVQELCDRYTVLRDGETVGAGAVAGTSMDTIISLMVGRDVDELYPRSNRTLGEPALELSEIGARPLPHRASLTLHRGEVIGIAGLIGAGRTETLRAVFGLEQVRSGKVRLHALAGPSSPAQSWRGGLGMVSEDRKNEGLALGLSIADNLTLPGLGFFVDPKMQDVSAASWIKRLRVRCGGPRQDIGELSGGNQQKVAIARLLDHGVDVLLLDEPTRGIDVGSKAQIYRLIDELACASKAVLVVSSYLPELLGICDRIAVMARGVLGEARPVAEWNEHTLMMAATGQQPPTPAAPPAGIPAVAA